MKIDGWFHALGAGAAGFVLRHLLAHAQLRMVSWAPGGPMNDLKTLLALLESVITNGSGTATIDGPETTVSLPLVGDLVISESVTITMKRK